MQWHRELCLLCNCNSPSHNIFFMLQPFPKYIQLIFVNILKKKNQWRFLQILAKIPSKLRNYMNMKYSQPFLATRLWAVSLISLCSTSHFQVSPEMFNQIPVWALAGPLNDIHRVVLKQLSHWWLDSVFRIVVLLKDEPSPQSGVRLSSRMLLYIAAFIIPSILASLPVPAAGNMPTPWCCHHHASL